MTKNLRWKLCCMLWPTVYKAHEGPAEVADDPAEFDGPWRDGDEEILEAVTKLLRARDELVNFSDGVEQALRGVSSEQPRYGKK